MVAGCGWVGDGCWNWRGGGWGGGGVWFFFFNDTATTEIYTLSLHDALPISVKVTFTGKMGDHMDFRDVVHATQAQMLAQFNGEKIGRAHV